MYLSVCVCVGEGGQCFTVLCGGLQMKCNKASLIHKSMIIDQVETRNWHKGIVLPTLD